MAKTILIENEFKKPSYYVAIAAEFIATFILVTAQCALVIRWDRVETPPNPPYLGESGTPLHIAVGLGFTIGLLAESIGPISGAHMNPAVTIAMLVAQKISIMRAIPYIAVQIAGALAGAGFVYGVTPSQYRGDLAVTVPGAGVSNVQAVFMEMMVTAMLVLTIMGATDDRLKKRYTPSIPIALGFVACVLISVKYTGASLNPARSLGPAVVMNKWDVHWVYWVGPISGAVISAVLYRYGLAHILYLEKEQEEAMAMNNDLKQYVAQTGSYDLPSQTHNTGVTYVYDNASYDGDKSKRYYKDKF